MEAVLMQGKKESVLVKVGAKAQSIERVTVTGNSRRILPCQLGKKVKPWPTGCIGGSVVEFSPATREARVRFPANAVTSAFPALE